MSNIKKNSSDPTDIYITERQVFYSASSERIAKTCEGECSSKIREKFDFEPKIKKKKCIIF